MSDTMATNGTSDSTAPTGATAAVLKPSDPVPTGAIPVDGVQFEKFAQRDITVAELVDGMTNMGFQASGLGQAVKIVNEMVMSILHTRCAFRWLIRCTAPLERSRRWIEDDHIPRVHL